RVLGQQADPAGRGQADLLALERLLHGKRGLEQEHVAAGVPAVNLPRNGGHQVNGVNFPSGGPPWPGNDAATPASSRSRRPSSPPERATPPRRPPGPSTSAKRSSAPGRPPSRPRATRPSPATGASPPSRKSSAASAPRTSASWRSARS